MDTSITYSQSLGNNEKKNDGGVRDLVFCVCSFIYLFILAMPRVFVLVP